MSRSTIRFPQFSTRAFRSITCGAVLSIGLLAIPAQAQFGELLPPAGTTPPSTGTTPPGGNPFDLSPLPTTQPGTGLTPPGAGLTPAPATNPLPEINLPAPSGTPATPGGAATPSDRPPTAEEAARAEKAKQVSELIKAEKYVEAEAILRKELEENPKDAGAWYFLAGAQRLQNKLDDAIVSYTKSIEYLPEYGDAYLRRGIVWFKKGDYAVAALDFEFASTLNFNEDRKSVV